jgi:hypothetical protein
LLKHYALKNDFNPLMAPPTFSNIEAASEPPILTAPEIANPTGPNNGAARLISGLSAFTTPPNTLPIPLKTLPTLSKTFPKKLPILEKNSASSELAYKACKALAGLACRVHSMLAGAGYNTQTGCRNQGLRHGWATSHWNRS